MVKDGVKRESSLKSTNVTDKSSANISLGILNLKSSISTFSEIIPAGLKGVLPTGFASATLLLNYSS